MLILTRRPGESLIIETPTGERIEVTVLGVKGQQVRIGTDAPDEISIVREELIAGPMGDASSACLALTGDQHEREQD
jgi:carbon storage regulator